MEAKQSKASLRIDFMARRRAVASEVRNELSAAANERLLATPEWRDAESVALYRALPEETATERLACAAQHAGKRIFHPRCEPRRQLAFVPTDGLTSWVDGPFGILEPEGRAVRVAHIDLVLVPLLAFDRRGARLGYGGGYYDRALSEYTGSKVSVAMGLQEAPYLPQMETDVPLDLIVTESEVIRPRVV